MKKIVLVIGLCFALGGCVTLSDVRVAVDKITTAQPNPITQNALYEVQNGAVVLFAALNTYKRACKQGLVGVNCKTAVANIQAYTRRLPPVIKELRLFVKNNDQINAAVVYTEIKRLIEAATYEAKTNGVEGV